MEAKEIRQIVEVELPKGVDINSVVENAFRFLATESLGASTKCEIKVTGENIYTVVIYSTHPICFSCCKQYLTLKLKQLQGKLNWQKLEVK